MVLIHHADDHGINGAGHVTDGGTCGASLGHKDLLADAGADGAVHGDDVLVGQLIVFIVIVVGDFLKLPNPKFCLFYSST